jgi:predicted DNA-binding transcriptional regulator AlpA
VFDRSALNAEHPPDFLVSAFARFSGQFLAILALFGILVPSRCRTLGHRLYGRMVRPANLRGEDTMTHTSQAELMRLPETAALCGVSQRTVWGWADDGISPPPLKIGKGTVRYSRAAYLRWISGGCKPMSEDPIKGEDLARELGADLADLFERVLLGTMPSPYWYRGELVDWVANSGEGGSDE